MIWVLFHNDFSKKSFKSGFVPIEKIFLLFLVIVFFSETSFQLLTKEKADLSETKWTHELNPYTCISNRHCWYQIFKIQKTSSQKLEKFGCWEIRETVLRIWICKLHESFASNPWSKERCRQLLQQPFTFYSFQFRIPTFIIYFSASFCVIQKLNPKLDVSDENDQICHQHRQTVTNKPTVHLRQEHDGGVVWFKQQAFTHVP